MNRFNLENDLLRCWMICDDLGDIIAELSERKMTDDEILNLLIGIKEFYNIKFDHTFTCLSKMISDGKIK